MITLPLGTYRVDREEIETPTSEILLRKVIVSNALWADGLCGGIAEHRSAFEFMLGEPPKDGHFDLDRPFSIYSRKSDGRMVTQGVSTCGLVAERILELSGVGWPWRGKPYSIGTSISRSIGWAKRHNVWVSNGIPKAGDLCAIGHEFSTHVFIVLYILGSTVISIDGGQVDYRYPPEVKAFGLQKIAKCSRKLRVVGDKNYLGGSIFNGFIDIGLISKYLLLYNKSSVPKGWNND